MKTKKMMLVVWSVVVIGCVIAGMIIVSRPTARGVAHQDRKQSQLVATVSPSPSGGQSSLQKITNPSDSASMTQPVNTEVKTNVQTQKAMSQANQSPSVKEEIQDPFARLALAFVGDNPDADDFWTAAINDPNLPADERRELIEDLNQDGFSDPKNLGVEDLPLIVNRIQLIEELGPYAMDQINADAFQEAYKDLLNMYARLTRQ